jgi:hypothetical protein
VSVRLAHIMLRLQRDALDNLFKGENQIGQPQVFTISSRDYPVQQADEEVVAIDGTVTRLTHEKDVGVMACCRHCGWELCFWYEIRYEQWVDLCRMHRDLHVPPSSFTSTVEMDLWSVAQVMMLKQPSLATELMPALLLLLVGGRLEEATRAIEAIVLRALSANGNRVLRATPLSLDYSGHVSPLVT